MDAKARKKALFRAKLSAVSKDKRIDSPLVRYNESDQPVCRVCDVVLKSGAQWDAHQASRKHKEAIDNIKASAAAAKQNGAPQKESVQPRRQGPPAGQVSGEGSTRKPALAVKDSSGLPPGFFDGDVPGGPPAKPVTSKKLGDEATVSPYNGIQQLRNAPSVSESDGTAKPSAASDKKPLQGALPEGFFDNKEADLRARGIQPVKIDKEVEYKEFEKSIQEDLQVVDNRMEEEEIDAAEFIEEAETVEQKTYQERLEILRKKKLELAANKSTKRRKVSGEEVGKRTIQEESSSDDDADDDFSVDWRAQHV
ncbi:hypothetical protein MLD38_001580 [Melastoma candidum]|uniref:Uncharacterized protein n=1 Tax=Melastoma candidum TaxID=119954 RepID=A0ACB9SH04_9MYRT|nr:hypothetical protein MLD38_001580 [Melastoma candidum]